MYRLLNDGLVKKFHTLEEAISHSENSQNEWSILSPEGETILDWIDYHNNKKGN